MWNITGLEGKGAAAWGEVPGNQEGVGILTSQVQQCYGEGLSANGRALVEVCLAPLGSEMRKHPSCEQQGWNSPEDVIGCWEYHFDVLLNAMILPFVRETEQDFPG